MTIPETRVPGVRIIEPRVHAEEWGHVFEAWQAERYRVAGTDRCSRSGGSLGTANRSEERLLGPPETMPASHGRRLQGRDVHEPVGRGRES
jgi:hypothetical protein